MTPTLPCPQATAHDSDASTDPPSTATGLRSAAALRAAVTKVDGDGWNTPADAPSSMRSPPRATGWPSGSRPAPTSRTTARAPTTCCPTLGN